MWRYLADSNRRTRFCRPLTKPLIQGTGYYPSFRIAVAKVVHFFNLPTIRNTFSLFLSSDFGGCLRIRIRKSNSRRDFFCRKPCGKRRECPMPCAGDKRLSIGRQPNPASRSYKQSSYLINGKGHHPSQSRSISCRK